MPNRGTDRGQSTLLHALTQPDPKLSLPTHRVASVRTHTLKTWRGCTRLKSNSLQPVATPPDSAREPCRPSPDRAAGKGVRRRSEAARRRPLHQRPRLHLLRIGLDALRLGFVTPGGDGGYALGIGQHVWRCR